MAITALVLGIIAIVLAFIPIINLISFVLALLAIIFGIIGIVKASKAGSGKGMGIAGLVTGILSMIIAIAVYFLIFGAAKQLCEDNYDSMTPSEQQSCEDVYDITG
ncbi:hypothetical protein [Salininema proteolyticum]|uniref:DUF4190 domain-containing protein n=1 Tax=Salininema proteolyticum TaxID=1607685 RepID=A0ABV8TVF5_9ACTN